MYTLSLCYPGLPATHFHLTQLDSTDGSYLDEEISFDRQIALSTIEISILFVQYLLDLPLFSGIKCHLSTNCKGKNAFKMRIECNEKKQIESTSLGIFLKLFLPVKQDKDKNLLPSYTTTDPFFKEVPHKKLEQLLHHTETVVDLTVEELKALKTGDFTHPLFERDDYYALTLKGYLNKRLEKEELSLALLYKASRDESSDGKVEVFKVEKGKDLLKKSLHFLLNERQFFFFMEEVKKLPEHQQQFFVVAREKRKSNSLFENLLRSTSNSSRFLLIDRRYDFLQLVLHPACIACLLKTRFGQQSIPTDLVLWSKEIEKWPDMKPGLLTIPWTKAAKSESVHSGLAAYHYSIYLLLAEKPSA